MSLLACEIEWLAQRYEASDDQGLHPEWPPHPSRLVAALVAVARTDEELAALRWLCGLPAPVIAAGEAAVGRLRRSWVPTNRIEAAGGHQVHPGRRNAGPKQWPRCFPPAPTLMHWVATPSDDHLAALDSLARRVPYLGRSTSHVMLRFFTRDPSAEPLTGGEWIPQPIGEEGTSVRVPEADYVDRLRAAFEAGIPAIEGARSPALPYVRRPHAVQDGEPEPMRAYERLVILGLPRGVALAPQFAVKIAKALRARVRERIEERSDIDPDLLIAVHGHRRANDDDTRQLAFMAVPEVGFPHSSGQVRGVAVAIPNDVVPELRRAVVRALRGDGFEDDGLTTLRIPGVADLTDLLPEPQPPVGRRTLSQGHWCAESREWTSVTPVVLPRFPRRDLAAEAVVVETLAHIGLPVPESVEWRRAPFVVGGVDLRANQTVRHRGAQVQAFGHVRIRFSDPVAGPILVGAMRHYGLGLLIPRPDKAAS